MNIELRKWYLHSLGLSQYTSKIKSINQFDNSSSKDNEDKITVADKLKLVNTSLVANGSIQNEIMGNSPLELRPEKELKIKDTPNDTIDSPQFRFACWQPCEELIIFNELGPNTLPDTNLTQLLANILSAIDRLPSDFAPANIIDWPVEGSDKEHQADAYKMLSAFIDARRKKSCACLIILMGEMPFKMLAPSDKLYSDCLGKTIYIKDINEALVLRSLQDNLKYPARKKETWNSIKHLIRKH